MGPDMGAGRSAGCRADRRDPARVARLGVLVFLADRVGVERGYEAERTEQIDLGDRDFVGDAAEGGCDTIGEPPSRRRSPSRRRCSGSQSSRPD